ncbi:MAG TPA: protein-glutamate O-methyltransferase CheR [Fimbriimonadaceae bacterium]|nr:protein-glutamate O-methyltransferase CheR [Fimbriimonadaceae bacterium]HRJ33592.1 protein-glutamate O-methyltransferase CheR [Fimbriimonadaceae bacterium]
MLPSPLEWSQFYSQLRSKAGLDLDDYKANQIQRRIVSMMENRGAATLAQFWKDIGSNPESLQWFLDKLAINVSELFRNPERWKDLRETVLPELLQRSSRLKIWSAGCSYGAEAHSLAVLLHAHFPGTHQIIGTDIDQSALEQAQRGHFSQADMKAVPVEYRRTYFDPQGETWHAKEEIKRYLTFRKGNLLSDQFDSQFDLILCRNVVIYFTDKAKEQLYARFMESLKPGGYLLVGSTERIYNHRNLGLESALPFFYRKPISGAQQWQNAS